MKTPRILVWRNGKLGNTIAAVPLILALRRALPDAYIAVAVEPLGKDLLLHYPEIDELILYDKRGLHKGLAAHLSFILKLRQKRFTHSVHIKRFFRNEFLSFLMGIPNRFGFNRNNGGRGLLTAVIPYREDIRVVEANTGLLSLFGLPVPETPAYRFYSAPVDLSEANGFLEQTGLTKKRFALFHCGGETVKGRGAPAELFAQIAHHLWKKTGLIPLFMNGPGDAEMVRAVTARLPQDVPFAECPLRNIRANAEVARQAALFIGNNSGQAHLAALVATPTLVLYGDNPDTELMMRKWLPWQERVKAILVRDTTFPSIDPAIQDVLR